MKYLVLLMTLLLAGMTPAATNELPDLGDPGAGLMSPEQEYRLGRAWLRQLRGSVSTLDDVTVQEYAEHLVYRLASFSALDTPDLAIIVINSREINAFAVPGGVIGLNAGLFLHADDEGEVAGVIAHELAHVSQKHFLRRYADSQRMNKAVLAAMLASLAVAIAGDAEAGMAGIAATQAAAIQQQLAYSRLHEREADRIGMQTLEEAGMDPGAMPRFFEKMMRNRRLSTDIPEFMLTHPLTEERIADSRARAQQLPAVAEKPNLYFYLVKARLAASFYRDPHDALDWFASTGMEGKSLGEQANLYGLAVAAIRAGEYTRARNAIERLQALAPDEQWYRLLEGELELADSQPEAAIETLQSVLGIMPGNYSTMVMLGRAELAAGRPDLAISYLDALLRRRPWDATLWRLAADAWGKSGQLALAHRARGEVLFLNGHDEEAKDQLRYALQQSKDNFARHSQIQARLKEMEKLSEEKF